MTMNDKSTEQAELSQTAADTKTSNFEEASTKAPTKETLLPIVQNAPDVPGYRIERELGRGGMAIVYLATDLSLQRHVALKLCNSPTSLAGPSRFQLEAGALAKLQHPHIVQIFGSGTTTQGLNYFVMEYMPEGSLADVTAKVPQSPRDAARLTYLLAKAVYAAHQRGFIHRDLTPRNILLAPPSDEPFLNCIWGYPKIADFGLVKLLNVASTDHRLTGTESIMGTPGYMAPEQALSSATINATVDIFALGAILFKLLDGRPPFRGGNSFEVTLQTIEQPVPSLKALRPELPDDLVAICEKCLAKESHQRYASALELAKALEAYLQSGSATLEKLTASHPVLRAIEPPANPPVPSEAMPSSSLPLSMNNLFADPEVKEPAPSEKPVRVKEDMRIPLPKPPQPIRKADRPAAPSTSSPPSVPVARKPVSPEPHVPYQPPAIPGAPPQPTQAAQPLVKPEPVVDRPPLQPVFSPNPIVDDLEPSTDAEGLRYYSGLVFPVLSRPSDLELMAIPWRIAFRGYVVLIVCAILCALEEMTRVKSPQTSKLPLLFASAYLILYLVQLVASYCLTTIHAGLRVRLLFCILSVIVTVALCWR